jgi:sulfate-transporting ATPase
MPTLWVYLTMTSVVASLVVLSVVVLARATSSISLAQGAFMGISAYLFTWLFQNHGWPYVPAALISIVAVVPIGMLLAFPALRLRGIELSALTLVVGLAATAVVFNPGAPLSVGSTGTGATLERAVRPLGIDLSKQNSIYYFMLVVAVVIFAVVIAMLSGPVGRTWQAIKGGNSAAVASGIDITRYQLLGFAVSSAIAGVAGILLLTVQRSITPASVGPAASIFMVVAATTVGIERLVAAIVGGVALGIGTQVFQTFQLKGDWLTFVFGLVVVVAIVAQERQQRKATTR